MTRDPSIYSPWEHPIRTLYIYLFWRPWMCRIAGHSLVRCIPFCFRCMKEWENWSEVRRWD